VGKQTDQRGTKTDENWERIAEGICMKERNKIRKRARKGRKEGNY
jgi:hypothetical protein